MTNVPALEHFTGCLLGQAVGDALGAKYEGLTADLIWEFGPAERIVQHLSGEKVYYTDDTEMMIGVAETLAEHGEIDEETLVARFVENYHPERGYGQGARRILGAMGEGGAWRELAQTIFPGGSLGNGAAMRAAPIGLMFGDDLERVAKEAERSAVPTHTHPIGIDGARSVAVSVALAVQQRSFERQSFFAELGRHVQTEEFQWQLQAVAQLSPDDLIGHFGNSLEAHRSVVTSIACFAAAPDDYQEVLRRAIGLGGDVDTIAAMAGAICGARLGISAVPSRLIDCLENGRKGRDYLIALAERLHHRAAAG